MVSNIFYFHPEPWSNDPIWRAYFWNGLVQPPTSIYTYIRKQTLQRFKNMQTVALGSLWWTGTGPPGFDGHCTVCRWRPCTPCARDERPRISRREKIGGLFQWFFYVSSRTQKKMIQFDFRIFFKWFEDPIRPPWKKMFDEWWKLILGCA